MDPVSVAGNAVADAKRPDRPVGDGSLAAIYGLPQSLLAGSEPPHSERSGRMAAERSRYYLRSYLGVHALYQLDQLQYRGAQRRDGSQRASEYLPVGGRVATTTCTNPRSDACL